MRTHSQFQRNILEKNWRSKNVDWTGGPSFISKYSKLCKNGVSREDKTHCTSTIELTAQQKVTKNEIKQISKGQRQRYKIHQK